MTRLYRLGVRDALRDLKQWGGREAIAALSRGDRWRVINRYMERGVKYSAGYSAGIRGQK